MRRLHLVLALLFLGQLSFAQYVYTIKADSVKITNNCDTAELIIENHTQNILGFLYNKGRGRTEFRKVVRLNDSTLLFGDDSLVIRGAVTASHGLTKVGNDIRLGQDYNDPLAPATLINDRQIPTDNYFLVLTDALSDRSSSLGGRFITQTDSFESKTSFWIPGRVDFGGPDGSATFSNNSIYMYHIASGFQVSQIHGQVGEGVTSFELTDQINSLPQMRLKVADGGKDLLIENNNGVVGISNNGGDNMRFIMDMNIGRAIFANNSVDLEQSGQFFQVYGSAFILDSLYLPLLPEGSATDSLVVWDEGTKALRRIDKSRLANNTIQRVTVNDANYTATSSNYLIAYTSISTGRTVTLPAASTMTNKTIIIKDESGSAGTHNITVDGFGSETIDGAATKVINTNFGTISMYSNGSGWFVIHF